jgi:hypothetical protein
MAASGLLGGLLGGGQQQGTPNQGPLARIANGTGILAKPAAVALTRINILKGQGTVQQKIQGYRATLGTHIPALKMLQGQSGTTNPGTGLPPNTPNEFRPRAPPLPPVSPTNTTRYEARTASAQILYA